MSAKNHDSTYDDHNVGIATRPAHHARRDSWPRAPAPRAWVSEAIGFDSRIPGVSAKSGTGVEHFRYEKVSVEEARMVWNSGSDAATPAKPMRARLRSPAEPLQDATIRWLTQLPESLRPLELVRLFPRIANKLCGLWTNPLLCNQYLTSLLMDSRDGAREGFPMAVAADIAALLGSVDTSAKDHSWGQAKGTR